MLRQRLTTTFVWTIFVLGGAWSGSAQAAALQGNPGQCSVESGQLLITQGRYSQAIREFTCVISSNPTEVEGYRGRSEAELLLGRYSDAMHTYTQVTAFVLPVHPDAKSTILAGYASRLAGSPDDITALIGASFARWYFFDYAQAIPLLNHLLDVDPLNLFGNLFRGSTRLLHNATLRGVTDLEMAIALAPQARMSGGSSLMPTRMDCPTRRARFWKPRGHSTGGSTLRGSTQYWAPHILHSAKTMPQPLRFERTSTWSPPRCCRLRRCLPAHP